MMFPMASCVAIDQPLNGQCIRCMLDASNPCPHSHLRRLNVEGWIKLKQKCNANVKINVWCRMNG
jgi:hypothetical protein